MAVVSSDFAAAHLACRLTEGNGGVPPHSHAEPSTVRCASEDVVTPAPTSRDASSRSVRNPAARAAARSQAEEGEWNGSSFNSTSRNQIWSELSHTGNWEYVLLDLDGVTDLLRRAHRLPGFELSSQPPTELVDAGLVAERLPVQVLPEDESVAVFVRKRLDDQPEIVRMARGETVVLHVEGELLLLPRRLTSQRQITDQYSERFSWIR